MKNIEKVKAHLRTFRSRPETDLAVADEEALATLETIRVSAVAAADQTTSKLTWCLKKSLEIQRDYVRAFLDMKAGRYYEAWCTLERVEIALIGLQRHMPLEDAFALAFIDRHVEQFQKLYPYGVFLSPAFVQKEAKCSICDRKISIRSRCEHQIGEIYDGKHCVRIVTVSELLEMSLVPNPVQKYSVPFTKDPKTGEQVDHYDYSVVAYVIRGLSSPFDAWSLRRTTRRHPHSRYRHVGKNAECPCGSGKKYKACCLREDGVLRPHIDIEFSVRPPADLPEVAYSRL